MKNGLMCAVLVSGMTLVPMVSAAVVSDPAGSGQPAVVIEGEAPPRSALTTQPSPRVRQSPGAERAPVPAPGPRVPGGPVAPTTGEEPGEAVSYPDFRFSLRGTGSHEFETDIDDSDASYSVSRALAGFGVAAQVSERLALTFDADSEFSWYDFSVGDGFEAAVGAEGEPVDDVVEVTLRPGARFFLNREWAITGAGIVQFSGEYGADIGDATTYGGFAAVRYQVNPKLAITVGASGKSRIEDDATVVPIIGFDWQVNDKVRIASDGLGAILTAQVHEDWAFLLLGGWRQRDYRLEEDADAGLLDGGVFRDSRVSIGVGAQWSPSGRVTLRAIGGAIVWSEVRFDDEDGDEVFEESADPTGFIGVNGVFRF